MLWSCFFDIWRWQSKVFEPPPEKNHDEKITFGTFWHLRIFEPWHYIYCFKDSLLVNTNSKLEFHWLVHCFQKLCKHTSQSIFFRFTIYTWYVNVHCVSLFPVTFCLLLLVFITTCTSGMFVLVQVGVIQHHGFFTHETRDGCHGVFCPSHASPSFSPCQNNW